MNYKFTALLIIMLSALTFFAKPAYPKNEYLQNSDRECGSLDFRIEQRNREQDYRTYDSSDYDDDSQNFSMTYRKYLGVDCKTQKENIKLKQQLELMKMCGRVNSNPSLAQNENFRLLVSKCRGVTPTNNSSRPYDSKSSWDDMKDEYKKENPDVKIMGDKFITNKKKLIIPKYLTDELPVPTND